MCVCVCVCVYNLEEFHGTKNDEDSNIMTMTKTDNTAKKQTLGREVGGKRKGIGQDNDG